MRGYVGVFTSSGRLIAYTETESIVRGVAGAIRAELPLTSEDPIAQELLEARRRALRLIANEKAAGE